MEKYAVALTQQSRFAPTKVGEFLHDPKCDRHIWQGKTASTMAELAEHTNAALQSLIDFRDPFLGIELIKVESGKQEEPFPASYLTRQLNAVGTTGCQTHKEVVTPGSRVDWEMPHGDSRD